MQCKQRQWAESSVSTGSSLGEDCSSLQLRVHIRNRDFGTMPSGKKVKLVLYEVLQFAALIIPVFVIMERFASLIHDVKGRDRTAYWLVVAASIAYVTSVTLLVWAPVRYLTIKQRGFTREATQWWVQGSWKASMFCVHNYKLMLCNIAFLRRPTALAYVILCTFPCFAILIASSKVMPSRLTDPVTKEHLLMFCPVILCRGPWRGMLYLS